MEIIMKRRATTVSINEERKELLEAGVLKIIIESKRKITNSEVVAHLIDNYLDDAVNDIIQRRIK